MTTVGKSMFPVRASFQQISNMKARYEELQAQLATGQRAANLAEMGSDRFFDLSMRTRLTRISGYSETMTTVGLRLEVLDMTMKHLDTIEADQRTSAAPGGYGAGNINYSTTPAVARSRLDEALTLLNADVAGRYMFGGGKTDGKPVESSSVVLDGAAGRDGFRTVAGERRLADLGASGLGRLTVTRTNDVVDLDEDGIHPFGFKLSTLATSSAGITLTPPAGAPAGLSVQFSTASLPVAGETVTIGLTLPDGSQEALTLKAVTQVGGPGEFEIGADGDATAANFAAALQGSLQQMADTALAAASVFAAADNFFNGHNETVKRVDGPPFDTATALIDATPANTVAWYKGEDSGNARSTVNAKVDDGTSVSYGVQANENGLVQLVRTLAAMSVTTYANDDPTSGGRFDAMALRQQERLSEGHNNEAGSIEVINVELALANTTIEHARERQRAQRSQLETMLADIETISPEEVAMEIMALKTRLEASFETTALVAQLSLVHYLP